MGNFKRYRKKTNASTLQNLGVRQERHQASLVPYIAPIAFPKHIMKKAENHKL